MPSLSFYDRQHLQMVIAQQEDISAVFNRFISRVSPYLRNWKEKNTSNVWIRNGDIENAIDRELINLQAELLNNISSFQLDAWKRSNLKNDDVIDSFIRGMSISSVVKEGMFTRNMTAFDQLTRRVDKGMNLSDNVWSIANQTKTQIEFYLGSGISVGRSADSISRDTRQLLKNPDARFRRIWKKDAEGNKKKLVMSQPMQNYHPGTGVYRSARMNALRTASTETNKAYRKADHERWQNMDFVVGFEIKRSGNNKGPCKICDPLVGKYPKEFEFTGWHPFCICFAVPLLMEHDDFADFLLNDSIDEEKIINTPPEKATEFIDNNKDLFKTIKLPKGESKINNESKSELPKYTATLKKKLLETENKIRLNKEFETGVAFDKEGNILIDKKGESTSVSFTKEEIKKLKDSIFTHNHPRSWEYPANSLRRIGNSFSPADILIAVNADVAEIRAVTPNYTFSMKRPENGWNINKEDLKKSIIETNDKIFKEFSKRVNSNTTTPGKAETVHFHRLWKEISKEYGWDYSKEKSI